MTTEIERYRAPSHREVSVVGTTESGAIIKAGVGHFDKRGPQAQPRPTPWDERQRSGEGNKTAGQSFQELPTQNPSLNGPVFEA